MRQSISAMAMLATWLTPVSLQAQTAMPANVSVPPPAPATAASNRPNVLVWMMDDVGFAQISCFGGLVQTPNIDRVARMGLRYTNYHTAPICSASRASFLTGRMPHSVHIGGHATAARPFPGYDAHIPAADGTIAANLHQAGYATYALGKWDHLPNEDASPAGPFTYWALGQGFDRFYGFLAADADNWNPILVRDLTAVAKPAKPAYHLSADLADQAIGMIASRAVRDPQRPFFMYWATGAAHAPHHAPKEWIARYRGKFDMGWDKAREAILQAEIAQGTVAQGTKLPDRPEGMPAWSSLSQDQKRLYARQMEVFAASLAYADAQFGRVLDALEASGELANTMLIITSDNGASAEGGPDGLYNEAEVTSRQAPGLAGNLALIEDWGGPKTYPHYSYGWAVAGDTPYRYYKQTAHEGGTRVPLIIAWPNGIGARGELRNQFVHVSDLAPTILDATGVPLASIINNVQQNPMEGASIAASFAAPGDPRGGRAQYVELYGNKGLWWQGWSIVTTHRTKTWDWNTAKTFDEPWELYDLVNDPGQTRNLAAQQPARLTKMGELFAEQAARYHVDPIHNLSDTMADSMVKARDDFARRGGKWRYPGAIAQVATAAAPPIATRSFTMNAKLELPTNRITGPLFSYGGQMGGIGLYLKQGRLSLILNGLKGETTSVTTLESLGTGVQHVELSLIRASASADGSADFQVTIRAEGRELARQTTHFALPSFFGLSEVFGVGTDDGSPVLAGYPAGTPLAGRISEVVFDLSPGTAHR